MTTDAVYKPAETSKVAFYRDPRIRAIFFQVVVVGAVVALAVFLVNNTLVNMARQGIATGFGFLDKESSFAIGESLIAYDPSDTYRRAFVVGLLNTLSVAITGIVFATILGVFVGIARLSTNWLIRKLAQVYVEFLRNIPLLLQLFVWWDLLRVSAPGPRQAWQPLPDVFVSNRGLLYPVPVWTEVHAWMGIASLVGIVGTYILGKWAKARQAQTGQQFPLLKVGLGLILGLPLLVYLAGGAPTELNKPVLSGFNFVGGHGVSPEFAALLIGLSVYTSAYIGEIVRSGIQAVNWGQSEAAAALGLSKARSLRLVVLPQALRVIVPPMTSQYLNITKNSSLAVAIGFPDLVSIGNTSLNQTGQAVEVIAMVMAVYLIISLSISLFMNWYNSAIALQTR